MNIPKVSVIVPTYNRAHLLPVAIASIQNQTFPDFELIVVDDCSTDGTRAVVEGMMAADARIRLLTHATNQGAPAARNTGSREARGEWLAFHDSDDVMLPRSLELRLARTDDLAVGLVHSDCEMVGEDGLNRGLYGVPPHQGWCYRAMLTHPTPLFPALLIRREAMVAIGFQDERTIWEEWDISIRIAKRYKVAFVAEPTFVYDRREVETVSKNFRKESWGFEYELSKHFWPMLFIGGPWHLAKNYRLAAWLYHWAANPRAVARCTLIAFVLWPFHYFRVGVFRVTQTLPLAVRGWFPGWLRGMIKKVTPSER